MSQNLEALDRYFVQSTFKILQLEKIYNSTKFRTVSMVKEAVYPQFFTGNIADSAAVHRKPKKKSRPVIGDQEVSFLFKGF